MCRGDVDLEAAIRQHGAAPDCFETELVALAALERDGLVTMDGRILQLTEAGKPLVRSIASVFDIYLSSRVARHSVAV